MIKGFQEQRRKRAKEAMVFVNKKVDSAKWFIEAIKTKAKHF